MPPRGASPKAKGGKVKAKSPSKEELLRQEVEHLRKQLAEQEAKSAADIGSLRKDTDERATAAAAAHAAEISRLKGEFEAMRKELAVRLENAKSTAKSEAEMEHLLGHQLNISTRQFQREYRRAAHFEALYNKAVANQRVSRAERVATNMYQQALHSAQERQERTLPALIERRAQNSKKAFQLSGIISRVGKLLDS